MSQDERRLRSVRYKVQENSEVIEKIVLNITGKYSDDLDREVNKIKQLLESSDTLSDSEIEILVMRLPIYMYHAISGLEKLGVEGDMAKAVKLEVYNQNYLDSEGTIQDKTNQAELQTINEQMIEIAFTRSYRQLRSKIEQAEHVFSGAKKVLTKRMQDLELHRVDKYN